METEFDNHKVALTAAGSAGLFALAFWLLDTGTAYWASDAGLYSAVLPAGNDLIGRLLYAALFAVAGWLAGAAVHRGSAAAASARAQAARRERNYQALLVSTFDNRLTLTADGTIADASASAAELLGADARSLQGAGLDKFIDATDDASGAASRPISEILQAAVAGADSTIALTMRGQDGREFPAEIRVMPIPGEADTGYLADLRETTASVVARKSRQHSERRYQAMFENSPGGIYRGTADGRLLTANPALADMLAYDSVDDLLAATGTASIFLDLQDSKMLVAMLERDGKVSNFEIRLRRRDGASITVLANIRAVGHARHDGLIYEGILIDISDMLAAREALQDSEEYFRELCEHSLDVITVIDPGGIIRYSSPSSKTLSSHSPDEQVGLSLLRNVHPDDIETVQQIIVEGFERPGTAQHFTCRLRGEDGSERRIDAVGTAFMTRRGQLRAVIHSRDVTDREASKSHRIAANDEASNNASQLADGGLRHE